MFQPLLKCLVPSSPDYLSIVDPEKCIQTLNTDELEDLVRETAVATLTNIIRSTALNQIAQSRTISATSAQPAIAVEASALDEDSNAEENGADPQPAAVSYFFDRAHDEFMSKLHEDFVTRYGVDIANIRMEAFKIMDTGRSTCMNLVENLTRRKMPHSF